MEAGDGVEGGANGGGGEGDGFSPERGEIRRGEGEAGAAGHNSQIAHPMRLEFFGNADATAGFMSRLIWDDASYHDGVVARPEGGVPEAEAIASVRVIFDQ